MVADYEVTSGELGSSSSQISDPDRRTAKKAKVSIGQNNEVDLSNRESKDVGRGILFDLNFPPTDEGQSYYTI